MRILLFCWAITLAVSCGVELKKTDNDDETPEVEESAAAVEKLEFEGYVQTAFEIQVDGVDFRDTEHFYTRFREDLIQPSYPEYAGKEIEILGEYSHNRFGSRSPVYMSPMGDAGHQFYAVTDTKRHFKVTVDKAGDQQYRAKIILRIGLQIEDQKLCYLLHSTKNDIVFEEGTPIIFNNFETQLNTFECDDAPTPIDIPAQELELPTGEPEVERPQLLEKVKLGMTAEEIVAIFGPPSVTQPGGERPSIGYLADTGVCATKPPFSCHIFFDKVEGKAIMFLSIFPDFLEGAAQ